MHGEAEKLEAPTEYQDSLLIGFWAAPTWTVAVLPERSVPVAAGRMPVQDSLYVMGVTSLYVVEVT